MVKTPLPVSKPQMDFLKAGVFYTLFCGGLGSGKTHAGALWAVIQTIEQPEVQGLITANTYSQLNKATLPKFFELCDLYGVRYHYAMNSGKITMENGVLIHCFSMEKPDNMRGPEYGWGWGDECAFYKEEAFNIMIARIRDTKGTCQWKGTTTPNGFNWLYKRFVSNPVESSYVVYAKTTDNSANLKSTYADDLRDQYDSKLAQQELDGQFINLTSGKVYYKFDRMKHVHRHDDNFGLLFVGLDFNVHPLCGVYINVIGDKIYVFGELYQEDSNTFKAGQELATKFRGRMINVVCDETGNRRRTSSTNTDHEILRRAGLNVLKFKNPYVKDRRNNTNRLIEQGRIIIDPSCKHLIENLEQLVYDNDDDMLGHITDALDYVAWHLFPLHKPKKPASVSYR